MNEKEESRQTLLFGRHRLRTYNEQYFAVYLLFVTAKCRHIREGCGHRFMPSCPAILARRRLDSASVRCDTVFLEREVVTDTGLLCFMISLLSYGIEIGGINLLIPFP